MDGVNQPGYRPSTSGNIGRLTIDVNGEVSDQVNQVVNQVAGNDIHDPLLDSFSQVYKPEDPKRPQDDQPNINAERKKTNNPNDTPAPSTIEKNLSSDGIPIKKHWIQSVQDVEDGVTNYKNSEEYRRLLMAKKFASQKKLEIPKKKDKKKISVTA